MIRVTYLICSVLLLVSIAPALGGELSLAGSERETLNVLLLSGSNNHDWRQTTPALVRIFADSGAFDVDVIEAPSVCTAQMLKKYDVVVSNWTNFASTERPWGEEAERALLDFVRSGKGFVVFHGATACFPAWKEFQQLIGATWGQETGHGKYHRFSVSVTDPAHPITAGLRGFSMADELWHRMQRQSSAHVLCQAYSAAKTGGSGQSEPAAFSIQFGKGRCFNLVLGHDVAAMDHAAWRLLMLRGTQWAATGNASIQIPFDIGPTLERIKEYERGQDRRILEAIDQLVQLSAGYPLLRDQLTLHMTVLLKSEATDDCKEYVLEKMSLIGVAREVPELAGFLSDPRLGYAARAALERIPGSESLVALCEALKQLQGPALIGVINSLGQRRNRQAVRRLVPYLETAEPEIGAAVIEALGKIGGPEAIDAIQSAASRSAPPHGYAWADALLRCADDLAERRDSARACEIYRVLLSPANPPSVRRAALIGLISCRVDENKVGDELIEALSADDPVLWPAAVHCLRYAHSESARRQVADRLSSFDKSIQPQVILALADTADHAVLPGITRLLESSDTDVRLAVLKAIGHLGDATCVAVLAGQLQTANEVEVAVIRDSFARLSGTDVNHAIVQRLAESSAKRGQKELIAALVERQAHDTVPALLEFAGDDDADVRVEAIRALGALSDSDSVPVLIDVLSGSGATQERREIEGAILAIARREENPESMIQRISEGMSDTSGKAKESLLRILGRLGGPQSLVIVRDCLGNEDASVRQAAVRVLGTWPDGSAIGDLLAIAREPETASAKVLALRGFADLYRRAAGEMPKESLESMAAEAMSLANRPQERRLLLSAFAETPSRANLEMAMSLLGDADLKAEAAMASLSILEAIGDQWPDRAKSVLKQIVVAVPASEVTDRAELLMMKLNRPTNLAPRGVGSSPDGLDKDGAAGGDQAAIDGDPGTYWDEVDGRKLYRYRVTFPEAIRISSLSIMGYQHHSFAPKDFDVLCDGKLVKSVRQAVYRDNLLVVTFPPTSCRTVELKITGRYGPSPAIRELEIYAARD